VQTQDSMINIYIVMINMEETNWVVQIGANEQEYTVWSTQHDNVTIEEAIEKVWELKWKEKEERIQYNQFQSTLTNACTLISSATAASNLYNIKLSTADLEDLVKFAGTRGYVVGKWRWTSSGVDTLRRRWNAKFPENKVITFRLGVGSKEEKEIKKANHSLVYSFKWNSAYSLDRNKDGRVDGKVFTPTTRGHSIEWHKSNDDNCQLQHTNTYPSRPHNVYDVKHLYQLVLNGNYYNSCYWIAPDIDDWSKIVKSKSSFEKELQQWYDLGITNDLDPDQRKKETVVMIVRMYNKLK